MIRSNILFLLCCLWVVIIFNTVYDFSIDRLMFGISTFCGGLCLSYWLFVKEFEASLACSSFIFLCVLWISLIIDVVFNFSIERLLYGISSFCGGFGLFLVLIAKKN